MSLPSELYNEIIILSHTMDRSKRIWSNDDWVIGQTPHLQIPFVVAKSIINVRRLNKFFADLFEKEYLEYFLFCALETPITKLRNTYDFDSITTFIWRISNNLCMLENSAARFSKDCFERIQLLAKLHMINASKNPQPFHLGFGTNCNILQAYLRSGYQSLRTYCEVTKHFIISRRGPQQKNCFCDMIFILEIELSYVGSYPNITPIQFSPNASHKKTCLSIAETDKQLAILQSVIDNIDKVILFCQ